MDKHITWQKGSIGRDERLSLFGKQNKVIWFTGLSGSGKSTIAAAVEQQLHEQGYPTFILDGDNVRHGLNKDLGFSPTDREENIRRIAEVTRLFYEAGITVLVSFISPYKRDRDYARRIIGRDFLEVYVKCPLDICEERDPKGLYKKARKGVVKDFTGVDAPYEEPESPEVILETSQLPLQSCVERVLDSF